MGNGKYDEDGLCVDCGEQHPCNCEINNLNDENGNKETYIGLCPKCEELQRYWKDKKCDCGYVFVFNEDDFQEVDKEAGNE